MKQTIAIGFFLLFCFAEVRPFLPFVEYCLNYDYVSKVLCVDKDIPTSTCNGKCYLTSQLEKTEKDDTSKRLPEINWEKFPVLLLSSPISLALNNPTFSTTEQLTSYPFFIKKIFFPPPTPPPKG